VTSIPGEFSSLLNGLPTWPLVIVMLVVSFLLIFAGRKVVKALAFLVVGIIGASIGGVLGAQYLASLGTLGSVLGILIGFFVGGLMGVVLVALGIGVAVGYAAYLLTLDVVSSRTAAIVVGIVFFIVGLALYGKILSLVTAVAGGILFYDALRLYGINPIPSTALAAVLTLAGILVQYRTRKETLEPAFANVTST
jgi:hypothetical protein